MTTHLERLVNASSKLSELNLQIEGRGEMWDDAALVVVQTIQPRNCDAAE